VVTGKHGDGRLQRVRNGLALPGGKAQATVSSTPRLPAGLVSEFWRCRAAS
jgi:hypothetical protein